MRQFIRLVPVLAALAVVPCRAQAQDLAGRDRQAGREAALNAKAPEEAARAAALGRAPGTVQAAERTLERGLLVYIFDIAVPGRSGLQEVVVSAADGSVVAVRQLGGRGKNPGP